MRVGDKYMGNLEKVSGSEIPQVSEIKEDSSPFIRKGDEQPRISPWGIDQSRLN
jgi:hypothetical protein